MSKKRNARRRARNVLLIVSMMLVVAMVSVGGTLAWLTAKTTTVTNTFSVGDINLTLQEHDYVASSNSLDTSKTVTSETDYKIVPGKNLPKDPFVTVKANSEACWLFVKIEESDNWLDKKMTYSLDDSIQSGATTAWEAVTGETGVYCIKVNATTADTNFNILEGSTITVANTITKAELDALTSNPTLSFTAYAVQQEGIDDVTTAWKQAKDASIYPTT